MPPIETWKDVVETGFEDRYEVSDQGAIRVKYGSLLKPRPNKNGYQLSKHGRTGNFSIGRLILSAFVGAALPGQVCRHRDGNNANNQLSNLYWDTPPLFPTLLPQKVFVDFRKCDQDGCEAPAEVLIRVGVANPRSYLCCPKHARKIERIHGRARATVRYLTPEEVVTNQHVYRIFCRTNNQIYVGRTNNLNSRRGKHFRDLKNGNHRCQAMQADYQRYGISEFTFEVLEENISPGAITDRELWWIEYFDSYRNGYNAHMYDFWGVNH